MKIMYSMLCLALLIVGCKAEPNNSAKADELFAKNSVTALKSITDWESEKPDYSIYGDSAIAYNTYFGAENDVTMLQSEESKARDKHFLAEYDFKLITSPPIFLPGVNADTKLPDGSVRYYGAWEVTKVATDSTEAKSGTLKIYESFDFNEDGTIAIQQGYGDYSGLMMFLNE